MGSGGRRLTVLPRVWLTVMPRGWERAALSQSGFRVQRGGGCPSLLVWGLRLVCGCGYPAFTGLVAHGYCGFYVRFGFIHQLRTITVVGVGAADGMF